MVQLKQEKFPLYKFIFFPFFVGWLTLFAQTKPLGKEDSLKVKFQQEQLLVEYQQLVNEYQKAILDLYFAERIYNEKKEYIKEIEQKLLEIKRKVK